MATRRIYHTHLNPKKGRNEPRLLVVEGWTCPQCEDSNDSRKDRERKVRKLLADAPPKRK